jgi:hypothetical protein
VEPGGAVGAGEHQLDERIDAAGRWRLSTTEYLVHHMGNRKGNLDTEMKWHSNYSDPVVFHQTKESGLKRLFQNRFARRGLKSINMLTFKLLYD